METSPRRFNGFNLRVEDLIVWMPESNSCLSHTPKKPILKGITAEFGQGSVHAIVGPSGSGKTTLLNYLAGRQNNSQMFLTSGRCYLNGSQVHDLTEFKNIIGYVSQDDIVERRCSAEESLLLYAKLRGHKDPQESVETVLSSMNLQHVRKTIVGDAFVRGLSGGEKKRLCVGVELIAGPRLLFLDEPTTGLDSAMALDVVMNLAELRRLGMTIICTIHQPSEEIMALFDKVLMVVDGNVVFHDTPQLIEQRLGALQLQKHKYETPIEFFMKVVDKDHIKIEMMDAGQHPESDSVNATHQARIQTLIQLHRQATAHLGRTVPDDPNLIKDIQVVAQSVNQKLSFWHQMGYLFAHYSRLFLRDYRGVVLKGFMLVIFFLVCIIVFINTPDVETDPMSHIQNKAGLMFFVANSYFMLGASSTATLILPTKAIFLKDHQNRLYSRLAYFWTISLHVMPFYVIADSIMAICYFFIFKLLFEPTYTLAWFWALLMMAYAGGSSFGLLTAAICDSFDQLGAAIPIIFLPQMTMSGFFVNILTTTWPIRVMSYAIPMRYLFQGLVLNQLVDRQVFLDNCKIRTTCYHNPNETCFYRPPPGSVMSNACDPNSRFDFEQTSVWLNFVLALVTAIGWRIIAFFVFYRRYRILNTRMGHDQELDEMYANRAITNESQLAAEPPKMTSEHTSFGRDSFETPAAPSKRQVLEPNTQNDADINSS